MPAPLTPGDGQDVLARLKRALEKRDPDLGVEMFAPTADMRPDPFEPSLTDPNAIRAWWNEMAATRAQQEFDAERVWVAGRTVLASWHGAYTAAATSERFRVRGFITLELDDQGLVERLRLWSIGRSVGVDGRHGASGEATARSEVA